MYYSDMPSSSRAPGDASGVEPAADLPVKKADIEPLLGVPDALIDKRIYQERIAAVAIMVLLIGFTLQYWIYSRSGLWFGSETHIGDLLVLSVVVATGLFLLLIFRWRSMRREFALRTHLNQQLHLLKEATETMEIGITISDVNGRILYVNQAEAAMHGYAVEDLIAKPSRIFAPENTWDPMSPEDTLGLGRSKRESLNIRADGHIFPVQLISNVVFDRTQKPLGVVTSCEDISERKITEAELKAGREQLRGLARHVDEIREKERSQVAHEIHNDLGAALTVLKINLALIEEELARTESEQLERAHRMAESIDDMVDLIRSISLSLRPFLLDDVGVIAAVEWLVEDLGKRTEVVFDVTLPAAEPALEAEAKEAVYRAFQEGVTNSLRHSGGDRIIADLVVDDAWAELTVTDNGAGLRNDPLKSSTAFGLLGLKERVNDVGGTLEIGSGPDASGTMLRVRVPTDGGPE